MSRYLLPLLFALLGQAPAFALERPDQLFKIFQFPADAIPRIDGKADDWAMVGDDYVIGNAQLAADDGSGRRPDPRSIDAHIRVGWVKEIGRAHV